MPQFQMLEPGYSFSSELGKAVGGGFGEGLSEGIGAYYQTKQRQKQMEGLAPIFEQLGLPKEGVDQLIKSGLGPEQAIQAAAIYQKHSQAQAAEKAKLQPELEQKEGLNQTINEMADLIEGGTLGKVNALNQLFEYGRRDRALYDSLALNIEKKYADMVGKGALNKERFKFLKERLPSSSLTDAANRGRLKGAAKTLGLTITNPEFLRIMGGAEEKEMAQPSQEKRPPLEDIFK